MHFMMQWRFFFLKRLVLQSFLFGRIMVCSFTKHLLVRNVVVYTRLFFLKKKTSDSVVSAKHASILNINQI